METNKDNQVNEQIGNAVRSLAQGSTFKYHEEKKGLDSLEWLDSEINRPTDEEIITRANELALNPTNPLD